MGHFVLQELFPSVAAFKSIWFVRTCYKINHGFYKPWHYPCMCMNGLQQNFLTLPLIHPPRVAREGGKIGFCDRLTNFDEIWYALSMHMFEWIAMKISDLLSSPISNLRRCQIWERILMCALSSSCVEYAIWCINIDKTDIYNSHGFGINLQVIYIRNNPLYE